MPLQQLSNDTMSPASLGDRRKGRNQWWMNCGGISAWTWGICERQEARWMDFVMKGKSVNRNSADGSDRTGWGDFFETGWFKVLVKHVGRNALLSFLTRRVKWKCCVAYESKSNQNNKRKDWTERREEMWVTGKCFPTLLCTREDSVSSLYCWQRRSSAVPKEEKWCDFTKSPNRMAPSTNQMNN